MQDLSTVKIKGFTTELTKKNHECQREREKSAYPSPPVMKNSRTWMVFTCNIMVILLLVGFATSFILTNPWFIQINLFLGLWKWNRAFLNRFHICTIDSNWVLCLGL